MPSSDGRCTYAGWLHPLNCRCWQRKPVHEFSWDFGGNAVNEQEQSDELAL